ncbi:integrase family protein [Ramlibacter terrae]|uniref:Integrase family protein n=1 Tax=Ramlibacter terrae TaxID=2732511 RepID=A0ABX6P6W1_9BURK|nr:integrase family protein [Ramlibacter terrae]
MAKVRLTAPKVEGFTCPPGKDQAFLWDTDTPGLGLRATAGGARSFIFQSRFMGKALRITIGAADVWPLSNRMDRVGAGGKVVQAGAREEARRLQSIIDAGRDPRMVRAEVQAADHATRADGRRQAVTVGEAGRSTADRKAHWGARHYADHEALTHAGGSKKKRGEGPTIAGPLAELMPLKLSDLDSERLELWAAKQAATRPARARPGLRLVKAFLGWCATQKDYREAAKTDAAKSKRIREKLGDAERRNVVLQKEQLPAWFSAVQALPNSVIAAYLQFMLLNGPRPNEPLALKWEDLNFQWRTISIRDKVEGDRTIPMTPYTAHLLAALPRRNEWVFSSPKSASGKLVEHGDAHDSACKAAGLPVVTLQGLRRSFATLSEWVETPAGIAAQIQGHAPQGIREQNYVRRPVDLLRVWHDKIEAWMLEQAGIKFTPQAHRLQLISASQGASLD